MLSLIPNSHEHSLRMRNSCSEHQEMLGNLRRRHVARVHQITRTYDISMEPLTGQTIDLVLSDRPTPTHAVEHERGLVRQFLARLGPALHAAVAGARQARSGTSRNNRSPYRGSTGRPSVRR
jgi:hypothetical protein